MTTALKTRKVAAQKIVSIIARFQFKDDPRKVVYTVRSSTGTRTYEVSMFNGKATGCGCDSRKPCYHMIQLEAREQERQTIEAAQAIVTDERDEEYETWKRDNGLDHAMSREQYTAFFTPCEY